MMAEKVFEDAIKLPTPQERAAYVRGACGEDQVLRQQVESLIQAHDEVGGFMPTDPGEAVITIPDRPLSEKEGTCIGRYKLLQRIGEGGMGVIYMAEQTEPVTRKVALKIIKLGLDTKSVIARFEAERQALAMMDHPNIAKVFDAGSTDTGRPYFVMELVKGVPINQYCDKNHLPTKERLLLFIAVCQAIHHAHQKGVIHRDIKPSNILVTLHDGKPVPKVIDFGIAKATNQKLTERTLFTHFAQMIGTPAYMSPEQAEMSGLDVDTRTDVYSLGVLLYELLTGTTPFPEKELLSKGYGEMQRIIAEQEPERPSLRVSTFVGEQQTIVAKNRSTERLTLQRQIKGDLDWIVMKALDKDRTHRYDTPNNLAADIERHLSDEPVLAAQPTFLYQFGKLYRRHKVALATAACFALLLIVSAGVAAAQAIKNKSLFTAAEEARLKEMSAKQRETELRRIAETERDRSQRLLYVADMNLSKRAWDEANVGWAVELLQRHRPQPGQSDLRNFEWFYLDRLCHKELLALSGHAGRVGCVTFSSDGKRVASASGDGTVKVWDAATDQETLTLKAHSNGARCVAFSPDGKRLASGSWFSDTGPGELKVWDAISGQEMLTLKGHSNGVASVAFSPDGTRLTSADWGYGPGEIKLWDTMSGREMLTLKGHKEYVTCVAFSPDGRRLASASGDSTMRLWDAATGRETLILKGHERPVSSVAWSPDGRRVASAGEDATVRVWDATTGQEILTLKGHNGVLLTVTFSPDGRRLASAGVDRMVRVWDATSGQEVLTLKGHSEVIYSVAFSPDGQRLASASGDQTLKMWDVTTDQEALRLTLPGAVRGVVWSPDGKQLACACWDNTVRVWDPTLDRESLTLMGHTGMVSCVAFSPDGKRIASGSADHTVRVWDATSGHETLTLKKLSSPRGVAFSPDGKRLASGHYDGRVRVWNATTGQEALNLKGHTQEIYSIAFSPDGRRLASASGDTTMRLWDTTTGQETLILGRSNLVALCLAFSPDGKTLASGCYDRTVRVWNIGTGQETLTLKGHNEPVSSVAFSPDGKRLVSASGPIMKVWDAMTGQEILTLKGHNDRVSSVAFSPDGKRREDSEGVGRPATPARKHSRRENAVMV
jgi:WD40 repeat protein/serine/threonine protein kinase